MGSPYAQNHPSFSPPPTVGGNNPMHPMNHLPHPCMQITMHMHGPLCNPNFSEGPAKSYNPYGPP
jgi:hypothetical protein